MRVLVTGAGGFIGKNLAEHPRFGQFEACRADWRSPWLEDAIGVMRPDAIVHLAGHVGGIQDNINSPVDYLADNLDVGMRLLKACRQFKVRKVLNIGSSCMYPVDAPQPFKEESLLTGPVEATNEAYALAKLTIMRYGQFLTKAGQVEVKTLIPPGLYGPHAHFEGDRAHLVCAVMGRLHKAKVEGVESVPIWGDGTARREFLFAPDFADAIVTVLERWESLPEVMNVGVGWDLSVDDWCGAIALAVGYQGQFTHDLERPSGQAKKVMDVSRAKDWGWSAPTPLAEGLAKTYEWYETSLKCVA